MPELPEVETIKNELAPLVEGRVIKDIKLLSGAVVRSPSPDEFLGRLKGKRVLSLLRRGKYLIFRLADDGYLILHLKMSGSLFVRSEGEEVPQYVKAIILLDDGRRIYFRDPRSFGRMWLAQDTSSVEKVLGPEPFTPQFTLEELERRLSRRHSPVKAVLLDQSVIAGIGNMYADEILYAAQIHPLRPASSLTHEELKRIYENILGILGQAIRDKGASVQNYFRPGGETGKAHFSFKVAHGLGGANCPCGGPIVRITVRGRGTYLCPVCQKEKPEVLFNRC